jgi:hypothetical protein
VKAGDTLIADLDKENEKIKFTLKDTEKKKGAKSAEA